MEGDNGVMSHPAHTIVHLFEWRWEDIALECKNFLAPMGFWGVQVSPPQEHPVSSDNSWKQRYQPVSYDLESRSGTKDQFVDMVRQCNDVGRKVSG
ncbi:hypothetical protein O3P69_016428 [Scylla paramamosain]|uniref:Alpha-amylase n=1 Tax=Scylla paramamosain TaxID=85552 RepID=A0AAW0TD70_SCYPA